MEWFLVLLYLMASEPTVQFYGSLSGAGTPPRDTAGWGLGLRVRIPVTARDALRLRVDGANFHVPNEVGSLSEKQWETWANLDYLRHGRRWDSGWYQGVGFGWLRRERHIGPYSMEAADGVSGSLILGREQHVGNGQVVLEGRLAIGRVAGQTDTVAALSLAYRHHFSIE